MLFDFVYPDRPISLGLSCAMGMVEMTWNTSLDTYFHVDNISLHTKCATMELSEEVPSLNCNFCIYKLAL